MAEKRPLIARILLTQVYLLGGTVLLTLAFAPVGQFYLAWFGLAPLLVFVAGSATKKSAFFHTWAAGTFFFIANMWWMANITVPGMIALMFFCACYWVLATAVIRGAGLMDGNRSAVVSVLAVPAVWVSFEWLRGNLFTGLPWLFLGHTQTPVLATCQIADVLGVYGVTYWLVALNTAVALVWIHRHRMGEVVPGILTVGVMLIGVVAYGIYRIEQTPASLTAGPVVAVVQSNYPQDNSTGNKGAKPEDRLQFHIEQTLAALKQSTEPVDLVVWSETMMPELNKAAREEWVNDGDDMPQRCYDAVVKLAAGRHIAMLVGGEFADDWRDEPREGHIWRIAHNRRNSAYFFNSDGAMDESAGRYDKIHLVPWGEFIPFKYSFPLAYRLSLSLGPNNYADYELQSGASDALTVFSLPGRGGRFVTPICFEDIDPEICARMFRAADPGAKRADFLVNLTNDGWFTANENAQHFQAAVFRSIENRVPTARSVNTGISGFIDSSGHPSDLLSPRTSGFTTARLMFDGRVTFFTRFGDVFALTCGGVTVLIVLVAAAHRKRKTVDQDRAGLEQS
jgi:apolipoprotein N-acyltransferase